MFASIMLLLAGTMGTLFEALRSVTTVTQSEKLPSWLTAYPSWIALPLVVATLVLGAVSLRARQKRFAFLGCATGVASLGFVGLVPALSAIALGFLAQAYREGEDLTGTQRTYAKHDWPDKALAASLFLLVAGVLATLQGVAMLASWFKPVFLSDLPAVEGTFDVLAGMFGAFASWQIYHLRRPWSGYAAIVLAAVSMGFYVIAPLLAATTLVLMLMANREGEFATA